MNAITAARTLQVAEQATERTWTRAASARLDRALLAFELLLGAVIVQPKATA